MQMEECSAPLARSTSDGSADNDNSDNNDNNDNNDNDNDNNNDNDNDNCNDNKDLILDNPMNSCIRLWNTM